MLGVTISRWRVFALLASLWVSWAGAAPAPPVPVHVVRTDLKALIRAAADVPVQFAVLVPHSASTASDGSWSTSADGKATWRYAVQVPTAVSLSFHAVKASLPDDATLVVRGAKTTTSYRARDLHRGELWSRIQPGDALQFTLTVAAAERSQVFLNIVSLQAGYRALGAGDKDQPYYRQLKAQRAAATGDAACVVNYECQVTTANTPLAAATVALTVSNLYQCSGVLINDVPGDNKPYVLTARHCESGQLGGGNPGAASTVVVYWDATTVCGSSLASIYVSGFTQTGAQTVVEQQDAWLILLDVSPVVSDAQFAGFDVTGGAVKGGYTIHHAEGYDKQFTGWFGQAAAVNDSGVLGSTYESNFWETVNRLGNVAPGASGSGLFDQNNHLVGSLTLGRTTSDPSGYGSCPVANPPAPNGTNGVADFTALWAVWNSTADTSSSTGTTTLKSVLDPAGTGTLVTASAPAEFVSFSGSAAEETIGESVTLSWSAVNATQCTAGGGLPGDGWTGSLSASGNQSLTESSAGVVTYTLACAQSGGRTARGSVTVDWVGPTPSVQLSAGPPVAWTTAPVILTWTSNVQPCSLSGGGLSQNNLAASGSITTSQSAVGDVIYQLTCGPANDSGSAVTQVLYVTPSLSFGANGTDRLLGQTFYLMWNTEAPSCTPSGGAPNDGWAVTEFIGARTSSGQQFYPTVTTPGTYTYTLTCNAGSVSVQQSVVVTFENNAPYATASLSSSTVTFSASPADYVTLTYNSNLSACGLNESSVQLGVSFYENLPQGTATLTPYQDGTYQLQLVCYSNTGPSEVPAATSNLLTLTVLPPPPPVLTISFNPSNVIAGEYFTASWSSENASGCATTGGIPGNPWGGPADLYVAPTGSASEIGVAGTYTFGLTCHSIDPTIAAVSTQATLTIGTLSATLTSSATTVMQGGSFTLTWSSVNAASCGAGGGGANGSPWSGSVGTSGSTTQTATTIGSFTYYLTCYTGNVVPPSQQVTVDVTAATGSASNSNSNSNSNSAGGGGHGGGVGTLELTTLALLLAQRLRHRVTRQARAAQIA